MYRQQQEAKQLGEMIAALQMIALMFQHIAQRIRVQMIGNIDLRPRDPENKRRSHPFRLPDISLQPCGGTQPALQQQPADEAIHHHGCHADAPNRRSNRQQDLHRVGAVHGCGSGQRAGHGLADDLRPQMYLRLRRKPDVRRHIDHGTRGLHTGLRRGQICARRGILPAKVQKPQQAERGFEADGAAEAEGHHAPQRIGILLRRAAQHQPQHQHRQDDPRGRDAHIDDLQKELFHGLHLPMFIDQSLQFRRLLLRNGLAA